jgi:hypothetical protein
MRTYVCFRGTALIGIIACPEGMALTPEHTAKLDAAGITVYTKNAQVPKHDGDINRLVDTLVEKDWLG